MVGKLLVVFLGLVSVSIAGRIRNKAHYCEHNGRFYEHGQQFSVDACAYACTCDASDAEARVTCEPLCPRYIDYVCEEGAVATVVEEPAGPEHLHCMCSYYTCAPNLKPQAAYLSYGGDGDELMELQPIEFER